MRMPTRRSAHALAWLKVYYRRVSQQPGFGAMDTTAKWSVLRGQVLADGPANTPGKREVIDELHAAGRSAEVLQWLEKSK